MKRRWIALIAGATIAAALVLAPVAYIEGGCRDALPRAPDLAPAPTLLPERDHRAVARTFLTYPEWHIVYQAESYGRHLAAGRRPSAYDFAGQADGFWSSYCTVNRVTRGSASAGEAKVTIYTIGISFTLEMMVKAAYERTIGRLAEWASGWTSADDRLAARVQAQYGAFMHETPWYRFPFGTALADVWRTREPGLWLRHWERRFALSAEYGVKAGYAKAIDAATGATVGRDAPTLRFVARASPAAIRAVDPRLMPVARRGDLTIVEAPRYQQFNDLLAAMASRGIALTEIAGNRVIFSTVLLPAAQPAPRPALIEMPLERPGWRRVGIAVPVHALTAVLRQVREGGGQVEHVYDY